MIVSYPTLSAVEKAREGEAWWFCDVARCEKAVKVGDGVPKGWGTGDPDGDPLAGSAQFCPAHVGRLSALAE